MRAARKGQVDVVKLLLDAKSNVHLQNKVSMV